MIGCVEHECLRLHRHQRSWHTLERHTGIPVTERRLECGLHLRHIDIADSSKLASGCAIEAGVEGAHAFDVQSFQVFDALVERRHVANVTTRIRIARPGQRQARQRAWVLALPLDGRKRLLPVFIERRRGEHRIAQHIADQRNGSRKVLAPAGQHHRHAAGTAAHRHRGLELIEAIAHLVAGQALRPLVEQRGGGTGNIALAEQGCFITKAQGQSGLHGRAAGALGQHCGLDSARREHLRPRIDVRWRGLEHLHLGGRHLGLEPLHRLHGVDPCRRGRTHRLVGRNVGGQRAVVGQQVLLGHTLHVGELDGPNTVARHEIQTPVPLRDVL